MKFKSMRFLLILLILGLAIGCNSDNADDGADESTIESSDDDTMDDDDDDFDDDDSDDDDDDTTDDDDDDEDEPKVGFEIMQIKSLNEIIVWVSTELTIEEFEAIDLPFGWFKNQPRETDPDGGSFARSPDATTDGEFTYEEHFGHEWMHNATVIQFNTQLDEDGLLRLNRVAKYHTVIFFAGKTLKVLVSPEGTKYVRISRDVNRESEVPTLPTGWSLVDYVTPVELTIELPNPTDNIRCDNEDSFQGPIPELDIE